MRKISNSVTVGGVRIGAGAPITVQSMLNVPYSDIEGNIRQAKELEHAGCQIIRIAVPNKNSLRTLASVKENCSVPIVADIHFDYRLALEAVSAGADKIRINPGNIGSDDRVRAVALACVQHGVPIRVGVNSGSVEPELLAKHGGPTAEALAESAIRNAGLLARFDFEDIVISVKSSDPALTVRANRILSEACRYPLHLGVTEAGTEQRAMILTSAAVGSLLLDGIGDTIRVSVTGDPVREVILGHMLLRTLGFESGPSVISCPTCGRTRGPVIDTAQRLQDICRNYKSNFRVAVMGCEVNGPGEASNADIGIAFGSGFAVLFEHGAEIARGDVEKIVCELIKRMENIENGIQNI